MTASTQWADVNVEARVRHAWDEIMEGFITAPLTFKIATLHKDNKNVIVFITHLFSLQVITNSI